MRQHFLAQPAWPKRGLRVGYPTWVTFRGRARGALSEKRTRKNNNSELANDGRKDHPIADARTDECRGLRGWSVRFVTRPPRVPDPLVSRAIA